MFRILNIIDTTGVKPQFLLSGRQNYTTTLGGIVSLINLVILGLIIYAFGKNLFERTEPLMTQNIIYPERYPNYTLGVDMNFTYAARLEDFDGNVIKRTDLVYLDFIYYHYEIINGVWVLLEEKTLDYDLCEQSNFEKPELFERQGLKTAYCPMFKKNRVGGGWDETYVKFIRGFIKLCKEGNFNNKGQKCGTEKEFKQILKNRLFISNYYQEYFVDSDNYYMPMDIVYTTHFYMLDPLISKKSNYFFRTGIITTDYGWILKNEDSYRKFTYDSLVIDSISISQLPENQQNILGEVYLYFSKKQEKFMRTYTKIQNLAANVGGIIKVFYTINILIASFFTILMMNFDMINFISENFDKQVQTSKNIPTTIFCSINNFNNHNNNFNNPTNQIRKGSPVKSLNNFKIIQKSISLNCENNLSQLAEKEKDVFNDFNDISQSKIKTSLPNEKFNIKSKLCLHKFLIRHLFCRNIYKDRFNYLEEKLVSIMDVKNFIKISHEVKIIKNAIDKDQSDNSISSNFNNLSNNHMFDEDVKLKNLENNNESQNFFKNNNFIESIKN